MASGDLFYQYPARFSMKNIRDVELWEKLHNEELNRGKVKNQIVMDALEMYYNAMEKKNDGSEDKSCREQFLEQRLEQVKRELREEVLQEMLGVIVSSVMGRQPVTVFSHIGKLEEKSGMEDGMLDNG